MKPTCLKDVWPHACVLPDGQRIRYTTFQAHGNHPAGTKCWVSRHNNGLILRHEYDNGDVIDEDGARYVAAGYESFNTELSLAY